jgi:signal transduction histidine kinase
VWTLEITRDGQAQTLIVPTAPMLLVCRWEVASAVLVAMAFWGIGTLLLWRRFRHEDVRLLFLLLQVIAVTLFLEIGFYEQVAPWMLPLVSVCAHLSPSLMLHYHLTWPVELGTPGQRRWVLAALYGLAIVAALNELTRIRMGTLTSIYLFLQGSAVVGILVYVYTRRATPDDRRRLRLVVAGTLLGLLSYTIAHLPTVGTNLSRKLMLSFVVVAPLAYLYATARHNLFGIDRLLNRALVYGLLSLGLFALYLGPILLLYRYLPGAWLPQAAIVSVVTLVVGVSFDWLRKQVQRWVDTLFYGGWYDYPGVVERVSEALARSLDRIQLAEVLTRQVPELMQLYEGRLRIGAAGVAVPRPRSGATEPAFPLVFEDQVRGMWTVGPRRDGDDYSPSDRRILETLARQAEVTLGNVLLVERLRRRVEEIRDVQRQLLRSREEERARLARELHDGPIQELVGLNLQLGLLLAEGGGLDGLGGLPTRPTAVRESLGAMRGEVRDLLDELRQVCAELRPPMLDTLGLGAALRALAEAWSAQEDVAIEVELPPAADLRPLPEEVLVNLYRVVQEALSNVARHAAARQVHVVLAWEADQLTLTVQDDGRGFVVPDDLHELAAGGHFGLVGMGERVDLIGGQWGVGSEPGGGTRVWVLWESQA